MYFPKRLLLSFRVVLAFPIAFMHMYVHKRSMCFYTCTCMYMYRYISCMMARMVVHVGHYIAKERASIYIHKSILCINQQVVHYVQINYAR